MKENNFIIKQMGKTFSKEIKRQLDRKGFVKNNNFKFKVIFINFL